MNSSQLKTPPKERSETVKRKVSYRVTGHMLCNPASFKSAYLIRSFAEGTGPFASKSRQDSLLTDRRQYTQAIRNVSAQF